MKTAKNKIKTLSEIIRIIKRARRAKKITVATNGCFDILHIGHIRNLETAKKLGNILVVAVNSDTSVKQNKGKQRPIVPALERAEVVAGLSCVEYVFIFSERVPLPWLRKIRPHVYVKGKGTEHNPAFLPEKRAVEDAGGKVILLPFIKGHSTTKIIEAIRKRYKK